MKLIFNLILTKYIKPPNWKLSQLIINKSIIRRIFKFNSSLSLSQIAPRYGNDVIVFKKSTYRTPVGKKVQNCVTGYKSNFILKSQTCGITEGTFSSWQHSF